MNKSKGDDNKLQALLQFKIQFLNKSRFHAFEDTDPVWELN